MTNCVNCGQLISKEQKTCPYCGAAQEERTVLINEMNTQQPNYVGQNMQQSYGQPMTNQTMGYNGQNMQQGYGQPQGYNQQQGYVQPQQRQEARKPVNGKKIGIIAGIAVALVLVIVLVVKLTGPGALTQKAALESYLQSKRDQDAEAYLDACFSKKLWKGIEKELGVSKDRFKKDIEYKMSLTNIDDVRKIKIIDKEELYKSDIKKIEDDFKNNFNIKIKISELVFVEYEYEVKEGDKWETESDTAILYKTGGKWFVWGEFF